MIRSGTEKAKPRAVRAKVSQKRPTSRALARKIAAIASDRKAEDIVVLDLRRVASFTDYFVIAGGGSDRHVEAVATAIRDELEGRGILPISEEGINRGLWALLDYGDVVVHVFHRAERAHYQLEKLWYDAPRVRIRGVTA